MLFSVPGFKSPLWFGTVTFPGFVGALGLCGSLPDWWCTIHLCEVPLVFPELSCCVLLILCIIRIIYTRVNSFAYKLCVFRTTLHKQDGAAIVRNP